MMRATAFTFLRNLGSIGSFTAILVALMAVCGSAAAYGVSPNAAWLVDQAPRPTNLPPGVEAVGADALSAVPKLAISIRNEGGAAAPQVAIVDSVPSGLTPSASIESVVKFTPFENGEKGSEVAESCSTSGQLVECLVPMEVPPGRSVRVFIPVDVSSTSPSLVTNNVTVSSPGARSISSAQDVTISSDPTDFHFLAGSSGLSGVAVDSAGEPPAAGSHPYVVSIATVLPSVLNVAGGVRPLDPERAVSVELPAGLVVNPTATRVRCNRSQFESETRIPGEECPLESQVGSVYLDFLGLEGLSANLFNLVPEANSPAEFGFNFDNTGVRIRGGLSGSFHLTAGATEILSHYPIAGLRTELWGNPSDVSHDSARGGQGCPARGPATCLVNRSAKPLLTMPSSCSTTLPVSAAAEGWLGSRSSEERLFVNPDGSPESVSGCNQLPFSPSISIEPQSHAAETPTGLSVDLSVPQSESFAGLASATLKRAVVKLPIGMAVNPPAANGLGACSPAQIGIGNNESASCPLSSKVGSAEVATPLLEESLKGSIYIAEQRNNPFGTLLALYLVAEGHGVVIKLPGRVDADAKSGQLTATFDNNPQLPFSNLRLQFNGGNGSPRATLVTPPACGTYLVRTELTSWASATPVTIESPYTVNQECPTGAFHPSISGGTVNPAAGKYSPFTLRISRADGEQHLARVAATLPEGLLAKLAGVPLCPDAQATTAECPSSSQIGTTTVGAGAGSQALYIPQPGKAPTAVYLSGPYEGAPYSLVVRVPAQAGPFDLGTVAVRVALNVDPYTALVTATSDPLPQVLEGIPIAYRDIRIDASRQNFIINPTSCEPMKIKTLLTSISGTIATPSDRFQVAGCERLPFKPKLSLSVKGATKRNGHPSLKAVVTFPKGSSANIARAQVGLPHSEFLEQGNIKAVCKQAELRAGACPKASIYGKATAWTPLLDKPLTGPVYLGVGFGHKLPDLVADLNGQIRILVHGKVDTDKQEGLRNTFEAIPDAPVSRFVLELNGGKKKGLIVNSTNICRGNHKAEVRFTGHNGKVEAFNAPIANSCERPQKRVKRAS